jgi:Uncharacterized protein conserved in bacteria C-term(DUF2220)
MQSELPGPARSILNALLDQFEQPGRQRVVRVRLDEVRHYDYFHADDVAVRRDANELLQRLAEQGSLRLHWRKWEEKNWLDKVDLITEGAAAIYKLLGRATRDEQEAMLRRLLAAQSPNALAAPNAGWYSDFLKWAQLQLDARLSVAPLRLSSAQVDAQWNRDLLAALAAAANLRAPALERKFSVQLFGDSKRFDDLRNAVVRVLRQHDSESAVYGDDDGALLRAHLLERAPEFVPIAGPLVLQAKDRLLDLSPFAPSVAIPATTLRDATVSGCDADAAVTVENITSFSELVAVKLPSVLAVYTGGFASPTVIALLRTIRAKRPDLPFFHWGDMDVGGLRILAHLRKNIGEIRPLAMDVATFDLYSRHAQSLSGNERSGLMQLRDHPALADCERLIEHLLETDQKLEQEAIEANLLKPSFVVASVP